MLGVLLPQASHFGLRSGCIGGLDGRAMDVPLLDWTESALVALYFAVRGSFGNFNAAVWALDAWWLNRTVMRADEVIPAADPGTTDADRKKVSPWLPERFKRGKGQRLPRLPIAVFPTHTMRRISAQRSCFTLHGNDRDGFETLMKKWRPARNGPRWLNSRSQAGRSSRSGERWARAVSMIRRYSRIWRR